MTGFAIRLFVGAAAAAGAMAQTLDDATLAYHEQEYEKAAQMLAPLAEKGDPGAQYLLGTLYIEGKGVEHDDKTAVKWFEKAANRGDPRAQYNLGASYAEGTGVAKSDADAARWFLRAANQGMVLAQFNLALLCAAGNGVAKDNVEAFKWLEIAFRNLDAGGVRSDVARAMTDVSGNMTRDEIDEAQARAHRFSPRPEMNLGGAAASSATPAK